jgi:hypothetical protein
MHATATAETMAPEGPRPAEAGQGAATIPPAAMEAAAPMPAGPGELGGEEYLAELHGRDLAARRECCDRTDWRGGGIPSYSDALLAALHGLTRWGPYSREIARRKLPSSLSYAALIEAAGADPSDAAMLAELHRRDRSGAEYLDEDPSCLDHVLRYPDALLLGLLGASGGWIEYGREAGRRGLAGEAIRAEGPGPARTFADLAREWLEAGARLGELDRQVRRALSAAAGRIVVGDELWEMDPDDGSIGRFPVRLGEHIPAPAA